MFYMTNRLPEISDKDMLYEYVLEHFDIGEYRISASLGITSMNFEEWVEIIKKSALKGNAVWGEIIIIPFFR